VFEFGIIEVLLVSLVLFIVAPNDLPRLFRKIGRALGRLRDQVMEVKALEDDIGLNEIKEFIGTRRGSGANIASHLAAYTGVPTGPSPTPEMSVDFTELGLRLTISGLAKDYDYTTAESALPLLFHPSESVRKSIFELLLRDPVFSFERRPSPSSEATETTPMGEVIESRETSIERPGFAFLRRLFAPQRLAALSKAVTSVDPIAFQRGLPLFARLPGLDNLDLTAILGGRLADFSAELRGNRASYSMERYPPQLTIAPSYQCNWNCDYCFTRELLKSYPVDMSPSEFGQALDWIEQSHCARRINFLGGEPTLYPHLRDLIDIAEKRGFFTSVTTNGLSDSTVWEDIVRRASFQAATFHIERDEKYSRAQAVDLKRNIAIASRHGKGLVFRYNMEKPEVLDWSFLEQYFSLVDNFVFSFALTFPSRAGPNRFVPLQSLGDFSSKIESVISFLKDHCRSCSYRIVLAKPVPLCLMEPGTLHRIMQNIEIKNICEIDQNNHTNNIMINPDRTFFPCMALNHPDQQWGPIGRNYDLPASYHSAVRETAAKPVLRMCFGCELHSRGVCQAGCFAYL
jgi:MoaA/NifB/PqqE/SkfB family radical SAM enzyme